MEALRAGYVREAWVPPESQSRIAPNPSPGQPLSAGATKAQIEPWPPIDFPKIGILEADKSRPIPKLAQDGNDENFTKKGVLEKKCRSHRKSGLGPSDFSFEKSWGPRLGLRRIFEKYGFPLGAKLLHFPEGKWAPAKHKIFLNHYCTWCIFLSNTNYKKC